MSKSAARAMWVMVGAGAVSAWAQVTTFDPATNLVTIPSVSVGAATYTTVILKHVGDYVFTLQGATEQTPASPGVGVYDVATNLLTLPAVRVGSATYVNVRLRNAGNFVLSLESAEEVPAATLDSVRALLASYDALWATAVPANGTQFMSLSDGCYLIDGRTKAYLVADYDADIEVTRAREAYQIGSTRTNLQVLAMRDLTNPDLTARREVDISYDVLYKDGSVARDVRRTVVSGSTTGTAGCTAPQQASGWRFFGNRRLVAVNIRPRNQRDERYSVSTGTPLSPAVQYRRDIRVQITDPMANAKYVVVSGPGPTAASGGTTLPFSWKMLSPFVMRSAPEMAGKAGNYLNWKDDEAFRYCGVAGSGLPAAPIADCVTYGAVGDNWGITTGTPNADADANFGSQGWVAGGLYRVDVYNDDGWKTVNGHAGRTPIATYYETLDALPYTFVQMAGSGSTPAANDKFARIAFTSLSPAGVRDNTVSATPAPMATTWNSLAPAPDSRPFRLGQAWEYFEGTKTGVATGQTWPRLRFISYSYPPSGASSLSWPVNPKLSDMAGKSYVEYMLFFTDRNNAVIQSRVSFQ